MLEFLETNREPQSPPPRSIVLVEPEAKVARQIKQSLIRLGYDVLATAQSAAEALGAVETYRPHLIVMDVGLEKSDDGIAAAAAIQARFRTPVVFLTDRANDAALVRAQESASAHEYVLKPYQDFQLRAAVEVALVRHRLEQEIQQQRVLFVGILDGMSDAMAAADVHGNIVLANAARREGFGDQATIAGTPANAVGPRVYLPDQETLFPPDELPLARGLAGERVRDVELFVRSDEHSAGRWYSVHAEPLRDAQGGVCGAVEVGRDITEGRAARSELQQQSENDALTGVYNRRGFIQAARTAYDVAHQSGRQPAVFFIDLNGMKHINDSLGHREGDRLLMDVAWILRGCFRTSDVLGRFGGDEFVVLAPDAGDHADMIRERLRASVEQFNAGRERSYRISMSVGMSIADPGQPVGLDELVDRADKRMYEDKSLRAARRASPGWGARGKGAPRSAASTAPPLGPPPALACMPPPGPAFSPLPARPSPLRESPRPREPAPLRESATVRVSSPAGERRATLGRKRVLIVDDEPQNLALLDRLLAPLGHEVIRAKDGRSALAMFESRKPDLVLLDLAMPGLSGLDVLARIRAGEGDDHVPVIVLTAHKEPEHRFRGLEAGADDFLEKPADGRTVRGRVNALLQLKDSRDELRRLNEELQLRNAELDRLHREQRELTAFVARDLKGPLAGVRADIDAAKGRLQGARSDVQEVLGDAVSGCEQLRSMIDDLVVVSRLEDATAAPNHQLVELWDLLREVFGEYTQRAAHKHVTLVGPPRLNAWVKADRALLRRVIENILDNSLRYTPAHGRMGIATSTDDQVEITVSNNGPPIPLLERKRIFEKFARVEATPTDGNAGLGLYFCKRVVESLGGSIEVTETAEWPTSFVLRLPTSA